jgi:hypothetical protein
MRASAFPLAPPATLTGRAQRGAYVCAVGAVLSAQFIDIPNSSGTMAGSW